MGVYHSLTENFTLLAEFTDTKAEAHNGVENPVAGHRCRCPLACPAEAARLYVSNEDGHSVSVLDADTAATIATIAVGKRPRGMKLSADGSRLFVAVSGLPKCPPSVPDEECAKLERDLKADGIAIVDTATHKVVQVLHAGSDPEQFALSPDGKQAVRRQ